MKNHVQYVRPQQIVTSSTPASSPQAFVTNVIPPQQSQNWLVDSGAFHHVTADPNNLATKVPLTAPEHVFLGNGKGLPIKSVGSVSFTSPKNPNTILHLHNMLHVLSIT
uniref:Retrovirus-related Pol polyprotein from transposon TNT 1-94-like beta-barrel domain-containing protein n=1 Tax=Cajanus cajan TaxID=3821 RepID=A0A151RE27_CAJCA|nr:hypothetical protein KK1_037798 [Cajanus cajan]